MLDIHTVGAGGGSIAYIDSGGLLKVGPRSAGADPGPVCYGRGNDEPTVTDANVVLQTLNPTHLLGGRMPVRQDLAQAAIARLAERLGMDVMATAQGILSVVTANMARAIRVISVQRGHDPRDYTLVAFGGAGPLHAARLAPRARHRRILVPRNPGILCAMGLLLTDLRADFAATRLQRWRRRRCRRSRDGLRRAAGAGGALVRRRRASLPRRAGSRRTVDMRYAGQNYELAMPVPEGRSTPARSTRWREGFAAAHRRMYGFVAEERAGAARDLPRRGGGPGAKAEFEPRRDAGPDRDAALDRPRARSGCRRPAASSPARSTTATGSLPATASSGRRSSSRWTRRRSCCRA